jgi:hypothetical protein
MCCHFANFVDGARFLDSGAKAPLVDSLARVELARVANAWLDGSISVVHLVMTE